MKNEQTIFDRLEATKTMPELDALRIDVVRATESCPTADDMREIQTAFIKAKNRLRRIPMSKRTW